MNLEEFKKIRFYMIAMVIVYLVFAWAGATGRRLLGDDTDSREVHSTSGGRTHGFYHK